MNWDQIKRALAYLYMVIIILLSFFLLTLSSPQS